MTPEETKNVATDGTEEETKTSEEGSNNNSVSLGSSGGGCGLGFGSLMIFGLLGVTLALKRR